MKVVADAIWKKLAALSIVGILLAKAWKASLSPPTPKICGSPGGPPVTATRIRLRDGRYLAYKESGVPIEKAKHKVILTHGFLGSRNDVLPCSKELTEALGVYFVAFDRPGYGESDPHPKRSVKSIAFDIEQLADQLELGPKFYIVGISIGGSYLWGCLKYIPHRIKGAALVSPVINYRWSSFPAELSAEAYKQQLPQDQWAQRVLYHAPWLTYWWMTQNWFSTSSAIKGNWKSFNKEDNEIRNKVTANGDINERLMAITEQGIFESLHRELMVMFGRWEFDPMGIENTGGCVHIWQGDEDCLVPVKLQRYISQHLGWVEYHELHGSGHFYYQIRAYADRIVKTLLTRQDSNDK